MNGNLTFRELLIQKSETRFGGYVDELAEQNPEINVVGAETLGDGEFEYDTLFRIGLPNPQFTDIGEGSIPSHAKFELRRVKCMNLESRIKLPILGGKRIGSAALKKALGNEEMAHLDSMVKRTCKCGYYGQTADFADEPDAAKAFPGLNTLIDDAHTVNAGGTTADEKTSVYALKLGTLGIRFLLGGGTGFGLADSEYRKETVQGETTEEGTKEYTALVNELLVHPGLQAINKDAAARIKNITSQEGKTLTGELMGKLEDKAVTGTSWDVYLMRKETRRQLWESQKALGGVAAYPNLPTEWNGVPIVVTDSIIAGEKS